MIHTCRKCKKEKDDTLFHKNKSKPSGLSSWCIECRKTFDGINRANYRPHQLSYRKKNRAMKLVGCIRTRAKNNGITFDLDKHTKLIQQRIDNGFCEMTGIAFDLDANMDFNSPSIDRIDPRKGYVYSNIRVVCFAINCALNKWGEGPLLQVVLGWLRNMRETWDKASPNYEAYLKVQAEIEQDASGDMETPSSPK